MPMLKFLCLVLICLTALATVPGHAAEENRGIVSTSLNQRFAMPMPPNFRSARPIEGPELFGELYVPLADQPDAGRQALAVLALSGFADRPLNEAVSSFLIASYGDYCGLSVETPDRLPADAPEDGLYLVGHCDHRKPGLSPFLQHGAAHELIAVRGLQDRLGTVYLILYMWGVDGTSAADSTADPYFTDRIEPALLGAYVGGW
jgi:hypothetical protein